MADIKYTVTVDDKGAVTSTKRLDEELSKLGKGAGETGKQTQAFGQKMTGLLPTFTAASLAADAIRGTLRGMKNAIFDTVGAAFAQEDADSALRASLELTGRTIAGNYDHYKKFAEAQQLVTKFSDDEVQAAQNLLLQMTRLDQQGIDRATKGAMGLASVFKMDLQAAASLIQKAMEGNFGALGRYGIRVKETGTLEEKRADLLRQLDGLYGRATAATGTFSGKVGLLKNAWGEAQEEIGKAVTQNKGVQDLLQTVMNTLREFTPEIKEYVSGIAGFLSGIASVTKATLEAIDDVRTAVGGMRSDVSEADAAWDNLSKKLGGFSGIVTAVGGQIKRIGQYSKESRDEAASLGEKLWASFNAVGERATLAAIAAGKFGKDAQAAFKVVGGEGLKLAESLGVVKGKVNEVGNANKNLAVTYKLLETAMDAMPWGKHRAEYQALLDYLYPVEKVIEGILPPVTQLTKKIIEQARALGLMPKASPWVKMEEDVQRYAATAGAALGALDLVIQQGTANRMISLDNEYSRRLALINASVTDEDARQQAIAKLDDEFAAKRKKAARALGLSTKAIAISNAIIYTHEAAAKAMAQGGFILGIPWAAIIQALGWIQVGLIAAQPIPLAKGGYFKRETVLAGRDADYRLHPGEIVSPAPMMRSIVREELTRLVPAMAGSFTLMGGIHIHTDRQVDGATIFRELEQQARIRGFRLGGT